MLLFCFRSDNHEITYITRSQQPAKRSERPCLVTYNPPISPIDEQQVIRRWWLQHIVHDVW